MMQPEEVRDATALIKALDAIDPVISTDYPCAFIDANGRLCPNMALLRVPDGTIGIVCTRKSGPDGVGLPGQGRDPGTTFMTALSWWTHCRTASALLTPKPPSF